MTRISMRRDAVRNRTRIVDSAREAFAQHGADVSVATIARMAGVGTATLYRHFPSREVLLAAMFGEQIQHRIAILDQAVSDPDPWRGLTRSLEACVSLEVESPGIARAIADRRSSIPVYEEFRARAMADLEIIVQRLRDEGIVRNDFSSDDIVLILVALGAVTVAARDGTALRRARRVIEHLTNGVRVR